MINVLEFILVVIFSAVMTIYVFALSFVDVSKPPPLGLPFYVYVLLPLAYLVIRFLIWRVLAKQKRR